MSSPETGERTKEALSYLKGGGVKLGGAALGWRRTEEQDADGRLVVEGCGKGGHRSHSPLRPAQLSRYL